MASVARPRRPHVALPTLALLAAACAGSRPLLEPPPGDQACVVASREAPADSLLVVLTSPIDARNAPLPSTAGERFVFSHLYETLVRVDCLGRPRPGLAGSWTAGAPTRWTFILRKGARFWSGERLTAADVIASWRETGRDSSAALARQLAARATIVDDTTLTVVLPDSQPVVLGDPELAVLRRSPRAAWAEGTGPYRAREPAALGAPRTGSSRSALLLEPVTPDRPRITIHTASDSDARDLIDVGADLVLSEYPALTDYATARPELTPIRLAWDRTWAMLMPPRTGGAADSAMAAEGLMERSLALRSALARDATRADARPAERPEWWNGAGACGTRVGVRPADRGSSSRIVYQSGDPVARSLAERLAALAAMGDGTDNPAAFAVPALVAVGDRATAVALPPKEFSSALRAGTELAFVVSLPGQSLAPCVDAARLLELAPWLGADLARAEATGALVPLVDTRLRAVGRRDRMELSLAWDSTLTIGAAPGRSTGNRK